MEHRRACRRGRSVVAGLLLLAVLLPSGCKRLNLRKLEELVSSSIQEKTGVAVTSVTCPEERDLKADDEFECTLVVEGNRTFRVNVKQTDDDGNVSWSVPQILDPTVLAETLAAKVRERAEGGEVEVDCGTRSILADKGATFTCAVRPAEGPELSFTATVTDDDVSLSWDVQAAGEAAPEAAPSE